MTKMISNIGYAKADRKLWTRYEIDACVFDSLRAAAAHLLSTTNVAAKTCRINPKDALILEFEVGVPINPPRIIKGIRLEIDKNVEEGQLWLSY